MSSRHVARARHSRPSRRPAVVLRVGLSIAVAMGGLSPDASAQSVSTKVVYGCQNNVLYEPVPLMNNDHFGASISFSGDWNGDGYKDQVIGGHNDATKIVPPGASDPALSRAALYLGGPGGMATAPVLIFNGNGTRDQFGERVGFLSDLNGDGRDELVVTAPNWPVQDTRTGAPTSSSGGPTAAIRQARSPRTSARASSSRATFPDSASATRSPRAAACTPTPPATSSSALQAPT